MAKPLQFTPYEGNNPYIFSRCAPEDNLTVQIIMKELYERRCRVWHDHTDSGNAKRAQEVAEHIVSAELVVFFVSEKALYSQDFRKNINYALDTKKNMICIYLKPTKLIKGMEMQLANIPSITWSEFKDDDAFIHALYAMQGFTHELRGEDAPPPPDPPRISPIRTVAISLFALLVIAAVGAGVYGVKHGWFNAPVDPYVALKELREAEYLDISAFDSGALPYLEGKRFGTLVATDMGLTTIESLALVDCKVLNISHEPDITTLAPLLENSTLTTVKVSEDMMAQVQGIIADAAFEILLVE